MSEMKPTPGPWEATCSNENGYYPEWFIRVPGEPPVISYQVGWDYNHDADALFDWLSERPAP